MGLWTILEGFLLLANAFAILNEDRFLAPRGWSFSEFSAGRTKSFKGQLIGLIYATQYMRVPLILLNAICIFVNINEVEAGTVGGCERRNPSVQISANMSFRMICDSEPLHCNVKYTIYYHLVAALST
ncbi:hypothetical protein DITRI_Ditri02bG0132200 [Diplodiscus trichospermus]